MNADKSGQASPRLERSFYRRDTVAVARGLLGQRLVRLVDGVRLAGTIVETEAYLGPEDKAAHTFGGRCTPRNASMWGDGGTAYVYFTYGMHHCLNVVTRTASLPQAVLIRAIEPTEGLKAMWGRRPKAKRERDLCSGPAKLCEAFGIDRACDGLDLAADGSMWIERVRPRALPSSQIAVGPRIGIAYAEDWTAKPLRFGIRGNAHLSKPFKS